MKELLYKVRNQKKEIEEQEERLARLEARAQNLSAKIASESGVMTQNHHDRMCDAIVKILDIKEQLQCDILEYYMALEKIEISIKSLSAIQRRIIRLYYIDCLTAKEIAEKIGYSMRYVYQLRDSGLI